MKARQIIVDGGFGPEDFAVLDAAFNAAWTQIEGRTSVANGEERDAARDRLARIIVTLCKAHEHDAGALETNALAVFDRRD
jgi:hypothetical protein